MNWLRPIIIITPPAFQGLFGKGLRHVATLGPTWLALIGRQAGAFKLATRDRWIGWGADLKLVNIL